MSDSTRIDQFKAEIAAMAVTDPVTVRERRLVRLGVALMVIGLGTGVVAFVLSQGTNLVLNQNDDIILGLIAISAVIVGATVFLRYSLGTFLRFWLARLIYEQRVQGDRLIGSGPPVAGDDDDLRVPAAPGPAER